MTESGGRDVAVVAGASGRLGSAIVRRLLATGLAVVGVTRSGDSGAAEEGLLQIRADLRDDACIRLVAEAIAGRRVAMVVNAAGASRPGDVSAVSPAEIPALVDLKVGGLLRLVRGAEQGLTAGSRIVAVGGRLGYDPDHRAAAAGIANAAVANLVRQLAQTLGPRGVTAHVLAPGAVAASAGREPDPTLPAREAELLGPLARLPTADDVAWAVTTLLDPAASFLNGGALILDGGRRTALP